jgi:quercetin dioxygenase-like cupin family protein
MQNNFSRPFRPIEIAPSTLELFQLNEMALQLKSEDAFTKSGRNSLSLARSRELTIVLAVLRKDTIMRDHKAPGPATVILLSGEIDFESSQVGKTVKLTSGNSVVFSADLFHTVTAIEDSVYLIVIGGKLEVH